MVRFDHIRSTLYNYEQHSEMHFTVKRHNFWVEIKGEMLSYFVQIPPDHSIPHSHISYTFQQKMSAFGYIVCVGTGCGYISDYTANDYYNQRQ